MNSQVVSIDHALKSRKTFFILTTLIAVSLFLRAGFISVSVIWFFALCVYNFHTSIVQQQIQRYIVFVLPIALYLLYLLWAFFSDDLSIAIDLILRKVHLLLIPLGFMVINKRLSPKEVHIILAVFLIGCLMCSMICIAGAVINIIHFKGFVEQAVEGSPYYFTYFNLTEPVNIPPVYLGMYCNLALLVTLKTPFLNASFKMLIALYLCIFVIMLSSTIGIVTLAVTTVLWLQKTSYKNLSRYILGGIFVFSVLLGFYKSSFLSDKFKVDYDEHSGDMVNTMPSRLAIWSSAWEAIKENPIMGYGSGAGQKALEESYVRMGFTWGVRESFNAHNEFLSTWLDLGILGVFILVTMLIYPLIQAIQSKDILATCFLVMIFLFFCVESVLVRQKGIVFFSFFYSLIFSHRNNQNIRRV